jgi:uncharacterized membrane protein YccC
MSSKSVKRVISQGGIVSQLYWRIGILVALNLLVVALAIWEFGLFNEKVTRLVDRTGKALDLARVVRRNIFESVIAEKAVVLSDDDAESKDFKNKSLEFRKQVEAGRSELIRTLDGTGYVEEKRLLDELDHLLDLFYTEQDKALEYGISNTNAKAWVQFDGELRGLLAQFDRQMQDLATEADSKNPEVARLALSLEHFLPQLGVLAVDQPFP